MQTLTEQVDLGVDQFSSGNLLLGFFKLRPAMLLKQRQGRCSGEFKHLSMCVFGPHTHALRWLNPERFWLVHLFCVNKLMPQTLHRTRLRRRNGRRSERWNLRAARHFHNKWLWWQVTNPGIYLVIPDSLLLLGFHISIQMPMVCARPADRFTLSNGQTVAAV